jgi:putative thioredoxin
MEELEEIRQEKLRQMLNKLKEVESKMDVTDADFEKNVIEASKQKPVLVDFWATWCVPCNVLTPLLERVVKSYKGKISLVKMNVDESPETANRFAINAIPAVKLFKDGKEAAQFVGVVPEATIRHTIDTNI